MNFGSGSLKVAAVIYASAAVMYNRQQHQLTPVLTDFQVWGRNSRLQVFHKNLFWKIWETPVPEEENKVRQNTEYIGIFQDNG